MDRPAIAAYPPGARLPTRVIDDFEFVWMLVGTARLLMDDAEIEVPPGRLLLVPPRTPHAFSWDPDRPSRHGYVHFSDRDGRLGSMPAPRIRTMTAADPLAGLCAYLLYLGRTDPGAWEERARQTLRYLCDVFVSGPLPSNDDAPHPSPSVAAVVGFLCSAWSEMPLQRIKVGDLATAASVSRSYLNRSFRRDIGLSCAEALEWLRCSRAETLLARTDMAIGSIARQCGFADQYHFSHRFTRLYGVSPRTYRHTGAPTSALDHPGIRRLTVAVWG